MKTRQEQNEYQRKWRAAHPDYNKERYRANPEPREYIVEWQRKHRAEHPEIYVARTRRWRQAHKEARQAHVKVSRAIRAGKLTRKPCQECGNPKSHAHHPDYKNQLEVIWLCALHHKQEHNRNEILDNENASA